MWGYSSADVARMLGLPVERVRAWARLGLASPGRSPRGDLRFSFQDLVLLRTARELGAAHVPMRRVRRALRRLRGQLPSDRSLASVRIAADGEELVVRDGQVAWRPESGQTLFEFDVASVAEQVAPLIREASRSVDVSGLDAQAWFTWGADLEAGAPAQARKAYARALALDPDHAAANLAMGRILQEGGEPARAEPHIRRALEARPGDAAAMFRLGSVLEEQGRHDEALLAFARCIESDPRRAEAHLRAAFILERLGRHGEALRHRAAHRRLSR